MTGMEERVIIIKKTAGRVKELKTIRDWKIMA